MAAVYRAYEPSLDRYVALKVLPTESLADPAFTARFRREAKVIAALEHRHIVPIYAYGIDDGVPWMATWYISGSRAGLPPSRSRRTASNAMIVMAWR